MPERWDAIVVGSGAAGSMAVKELCERGMDVLLLEAGRDLTEEDFNPPPPQPPRAMGVGVWPRIKAALKGQPIQARRAFYSPTTDKFLVNDRQNPYTTPSDAWFLWIRGRILGGRLNTYGRMLLRMSDYDFKGFSRDGQGADWPIDTQDIAPWYDHVERFIGIYGQSDHLAQMPDGIYMGESRLTESEKAFRSTIERGHPERRVVSWRYQSPNLGRIPKGIAAARETGRLTTITNAVVSRITSDDKSGRATGAVYIDSVTKQEHTVAGDVIVLCASAIESIRLLLNSGTSRHPNGLGNSSGLLGRYFMDQAPSLTFGLIPEMKGWERDDTTEPDPFYPPPGGVFIPRYHNLDGGSAAPFHRGISFQGAMGRFPLPDDHPAAFALMGYGEMLPYHDNTVSLDQRRTDAWGVPAPHIRCRPRENERKLMQAQINAVTQMTQEAGLRLNFTGSALGLASTRPFPDADPVSRLAFRLGFTRTVCIGAAIHECGGVRMGSDPNSSLLNEFNQSWDVPNLFVTDGSCFASNGLVGPTLTIMALTARACDHIAREHARGAL